MTTDRHYLSCADTAKLVRTALKHAFPGTKFSVRSDVYAGGASIRVHWTDGPTTDDVDGIVKGYAGGRFDGMIDLAYSVSHWLLPDGTTVLASTYGHSFDNATHTPEPPAPGARLVHFGANYVFTERTTSKALMVKGAENAVAHYALGDAFWATFGARPAADLVTDSEYGPVWNPDFIGLYAGNGWVSDVLYRATRVIRGDGTVTKDVYGHDLLADLMTEEVA